MDNQKASRGFRGKAAWKRSVKVVGTNLPPAAPKESKQWEDDSVSDCTVRLQKGLRDILKEQLVIENARRQTDGRDKLKEVDAVNAAIFNWVCHRRASDLAFAKEAVLVCSSSFDYDNVIAVLGRYNSYIGKVASRDKRLFPKFKLSLTFKRQLGRSPAFKRDLLIVASFLTNYEVKEYWKTR